MRAAAIIAAAVVLCGCTDATLADGTRFRSVLAQGSFETSSGPLGTRTAVSSDPRRAIEIGGAAAALLGK